MKKIKIFFGLLTIFGLLFLVSCGKEDLTPESPQAISEKLVPDQEVESKVTLDPECNALEELSFELTYESIKDIVAENPSTLSGSEVRDYLMSQSGCIKSEEELKELFQKMYSLDTKNLMALIFNSEELENEEAIEFYNATKKFFTGLEETYQEAPLLALLNQGNNSGVSEIFSNNYNNTIFNQTGSETNAATSRSLLKCPRFGCSTTSYPKNSFKFQSLSGNKVIMRMRKEGTNYFGNMCGYEVSGFQKKWYAKGNIKGAKPVTWQGWVFYTFSGFSLPYTAERVFAHRVPVVLTRWIYYGWNTAILGSCQNTQNWVKSKVRASRKFK